MGVVVAVVGLGLNCIEGRRPMWVQALQEFLSASPVMGEDMLRALFDVSVEWETIYDEVSMWHGGGIGNWNWVLWLRRRVGLATPVFIVI
jgi:hypothetical protein